jgi:hypothetical protein
VTELIGLGVPVLCLCQNEKELTHAHASARYGEINLGLVELVGIDTVANHVGRLILSGNMRKLFGARALRETNGQTNAARHSTDDKQDRLD